MAQMYPDTDHFDQQDVPSAGERRVYHALRTQLDDSYSVFHSVTWKVQGKQKPYDVDEAQDFEDSWWEPIQFLLHDPTHGTLYIFYDSYQNIFVTQSYFPMTQPPLLLTTNCRNTQHIHQQVIRFYTGSPRPTLRGPQGRPIEIVDIGNPQQIQRQLVKRLDDLVYGSDSKIPTDEIVVLTPFSKDGNASQIWGKASPRGIALTDKTPATPGTVYCTTIQAFKGLEAAVVILAEFERWPQSLADITRLLYVASSRARNHLIILLTDNASDAFRALFTGEPA